MSSLTRKTVYACSFCPSKFITRALLMEHTHEDHKEQIFGPKKPIVIKSLGKTPTPLPIRMEAAQLNKRECLICHKILASHQSLKIHIDSSHLLPKTQCIYCEVVSNSKTNLRNHMLMKHNISEFKCGKCNMSFMHLNDFIKQVHSQH